MEWIRVEDRLPILETDEFKDYHTVDVIAHKNGEVFHCEVGAGRVPAFWVQFHRDGYVGTTKNITHWMPLPSPPIAP